MSVRRFGRLAAVAAAIPLGLLLVLAAFPWGLVARHAAGPLSKAIGRPVTIGGARRTDRLSLVPALELRDVTVAQPAWAGPGPMASVRALRFRVPVLPLLLGRVRPRAIEADGVWLHLVRDADGRDNWSGGKKGGGGGGPSLADLIVHHGHLRLDDAKRDVTLDAALASDARGLRVRGDGTLRATPLRLSASAPAITTADPARPYPAHLAVRSPLVALQATVTMDHPLDTNHFDARVTATGRDLGYLDDVIQAGLFRTQPFRLAADVRHDAQDWRIARLDAKVGRSVLRAAIDVGKPGGRTRLTGRVDAATLDFDDFASDGQKARAAREDARTGRRVVPNTRIVFDRLRFDGMLRVRVARLLSAHPSPFRSLDGVATLDEHRLALSPLAVGLPQGRMTGTAQVDRRGRVPRLSLALRVTGASVDGFFPGQQVIAGPLRARLRIAGSGRTVREALAHGDGKLAFVVDHGSVRRDYATFLGGDVFKSIGAAADGKRPRTTLDCLVAGFGVSNGRMTPRPLLVSTPVARGDGQGVVVLGPETIDLRVSGRPTRPGLLLSTAPVRLFGTLSQPRIDIRPPRAKNQKRNGLLSRVGFFIKKLRVRGDTGAGAAAPVNCPAEIARALG